MEVGDYLSASQKKRKQRRTNFFLAASIAAAFFLIFGAWWLVFKSPVFRIKNIVVQGNQLAASDDIIALIQSDIFKSHNLVSSLLGIGNILAWPSVVSSSDLTAMPGLASVKISKNYVARVITVTVTERKPFAVWCFMPAMGGFDTSANGTSTGSTNPSTGSGSNDSLQVAAAMMTQEADEQCYWFDGDGIMFEKGFDSEGSVLLAVHDYSQSPASFGATILQARFITNLISIVNVLRASGLNVKEMRLNDIGLQEIQAMTYDGPSIYFSLRFPADLALPVIEGLMAKPGFKDLQYLDFRTEDRAYYK